jgi:hypothetical protein
VDLRSVIVLKIENLPEHIGAPKLGELAGEAGLRGSAENN